MCRMTVDFEFEEEIPVKMIRPMVNGELYELTSSDDVEPRGSFPMTCRCV